jgi:hypothetical protein
MECEKCGAKLEDGAQVCPECGEPVDTAAAVEPADPKPETDPTPDTPQEAESDAAGESTASGELSSEPASAPAATEEVFEAAPAEAGPLSADLAEGEAPATPDEASEVEPAEAEDEGEAKPAGSKRGIIAAIAVAAVIVLAVVGYFAYGAFVINTPAGVTYRFMSAYGNYDGRGMLQYSTHASMAASEVAQFQQQADAAKKTSKGKPFLKDIKIGTVTIDPKNANSAAVKFTASFLNTQNGKYTVQNESVTLVRQSGKWLVKLFQ